MKQSILMILTSLKKEGGIFKLDSEELISLMQIVSASENNHHESRNEREKVAKIVEDVSDEIVESVTTDESEIPQYEEYSQYEEQIVQNGHDMYENDAYENGSVTDNGEVMVEPIFEDG